MTNASLLLSVLLYGAALVLFVAAMRRRWFSRRRNGFLLSMLLDLGVAGVGSTVMVGVWGHAAADDLLSRQIVTELETVGHIMDQQIVRETREALDQMDDLSRDLGPEFGLGPAALGQRPCQEP